MYLPYLQEIQTTRDMIREFRGYNHNDVINENEFYDMQNMTSSRYPVLAVREKRGIGPAMTKPNGIFAKGHLYWVDGEHFYGNDGENGETVLRGAVSDGPKTFVSMGAYLLIFPDKKFYNVSTHLFGDLENRWVAGAGTTITYTLAKLNDAKQTEDFTDDIHVFDTAPSNPADGAYWLDTSSSPNVLKRWSASSGAWVPVATTYVKISAPGIGVGFSRYDGVKISGSTNEAFNKTTVIYDVGQDYITVIGLIDSTFTQTGGLVVSREVPDMDFVCEANNRVWGCSSKNHEIYASKLGDPFNWNCFEGISTDSYAVTVGSDGDFTGAINYMGYVLFFKENCVHKIYGSMPSNFQITETALRGVEKGSEKSLVIVNETLYYKSRNRVMAYQGGMPESVSDALGNVVYKNAVAGALGDKLYISMQNESGNWHLFVYDERLGLWHREDNTHALYFATYYNNLYFVNAADNKLYTVYGENEPDFDWYAQTGYLGMYMPDKKRISKIVIRMDIEAGAECNISMEYDGDGKWQKVFTTKTKKMRSYLIPVLPRRCDFCRLKISGKGDCRIYSISKVTEQGSEL